MIDRNANCLYFKAIYGSREAMDLCKEYGISNATLCNWRRKHDGMDSNYIKELKVLKDENQRFKQMYAELMLNRQLAKLIIEKKL